MVVELNIGESLMQNQNNIKVKLTFDNRNTRWVSFAILSFISLYLVYVVYESIVAKQIISIAFSSLFMIVCVYFTYKSINSKEETQIINVKKIEVINENSK